MLHRTILCSIFCIAGLTLFACSSGGDPDGQASNADLAAGSGKGKTDTGKGKADAGPSSPVPSAKTCGAKANHQECATCCFGAKNENVKAGDVKYQQCACDAAKKCGATCQELSCGDPRQPTAVVSSPDGPESATVDYGGGGDPCEQCEDAIGACGKTAEDACKADPTCAAATKCYDDATCDDKQPGPDEEVAYGDDDDDGSTPPPAPSARR